jgi:hypothetical protein
VIRAVAVQNSSIGNTRNHYQINPIDLVRILREAGIAGREVVGFYPSHPDHPEHWLATDLAEAHWLGCSYMFTSVAAGAATEARFFDLAGSGGEDKHFEPGDIQIVDAGIEPKR